MVNIIKIADIVFKLLPVINILLVLFLSFAFMNLAMVIHYKNYRYLFFGIFSFLIAAGLFVGILYANKYLKLARNIYTKGKGLLDQVESILQQKITDYQTAIQKVLALIQQIIALF
jgi:hypothetical protein